MPRPHHTLNNKPRKPKFTIRKVPGDLFEEVIHGLSRVGFAAKPYPVHGTEWWIAENDRGEVIAMAGLKVGLVEEGGYLCRSVVLPEARGNGLQRRLIRIREAYARRRGLKYLVSYTTKNPISANHLIDEGYRIYDPITPWGFEDDEPIYWRKDLRR